MIFIWQPSDIIPGRIVCKNCHQNDIGYLSTTTYQIGFVNGGGPENLVLISLCDGMVGHPKTKEAMAELLTKESFRPMPHKLLKLVMDNLRNNRES